MNSASRQRASRASRTAGGRRGRAHANFGSSRPLGSGATWRAAAMERRRSRSWPSVGAPLISMRPPTVSMRSWMPARPAPLAVVRWSKPRPVSWTLNASSPSSRARWTVTEAPGPASARSAAVSPSAVNSGGEMPWAIRRSSSPTAPASPTVSSSVAATSGDSVHCRAARAPAGGARPRPPSRRAHATRRAREQRIGARSRSPPSRASSAPRLRCRPQDRRHPRADPHRPDRGTAALLRLRRPESGPAAAETARARVLTRAFPPPGCRRPAGRR